MAKVDSEVLRAAGKLLMESAAERRQVEAQCDHFQALLARGLELAATGEVDGRWFGDFVEASSVVLGEEEPAISFARLLGYQHNGL